MEPRIISGARPLFPGEGENRALRTARAKLVIADWGPTAEIVIFPADEPVSQGAQFRYRGTIWIVTGHRRDSRIMVAEPVSH